MHFSTIFSTSIILAGCAYAQNTPLGPASSSTSSAAASSTSSASGAMTTVHVIQVSDATGALTFGPNSVTANPGDMVQFQFWQGNHSAIMSNFAQPCVPVNQSDPANAKGAFFSGFMPVTSMTDNGRLTYSIMIQDSNPIWYYCGQGKHCQEGMVGVINPPSNSQQTIQAYAASAKNAANNVAPGGSTSGGTASTQGAPGATSAGAAAASSSGSAASWNMRDAAKQGVAGMAAAGAAAFLML